MNTVPVAILMMVLTTILGLFVGLFTNHVNNTCYSNDPKFQRYCPLPWLSPQPVSPEYKITKLPEKPISSDIEKVAGTESPRCLTELERKSERDLLKCLAIDLKNITALHTLRAKPLVQSARIKTERWVVRDQDNKLDAEITYNYLVFLNKPTAIPQTNFHNRRTVTIEMALGMNTDVLRHPLFEGKMITDGLDEFGSDWSNVPLEVMNALLWARTTGHPLFPKNVDGAKAFDISQKAAVPQLTELGLRNIVRDYKNALDDREMSAILADVTRK